MGRKDYLLYWCDIAVALIAVMLAHSEKLDAPWYVVVVAASALLVAFAVTGLLGKKPFRSRSLAWKIVYALPWVLFLGIVVVALFISAAYAWS